VNFFDADRLTSKIGVETYFFVPQADPTASGDHDNLVVEWIINVGQSLVDARGRLINLGRALHAQGLVRTLVVEDLEELVELGLPLQKVSTRRLGGFFFQGEMHAFMAAVLLWMSRPLRSMPIPSRSHQTASLLRLNKAWAEAKGTPLGLRMFAGLKKPLKHSEFLVIF
jgi:hypothetical protein